MRFPGRDIVIRVPHPRRIARLLRTPLGRLQVRSRAWERYGPYLAGPARVYRRTALARTRIVAVVGSLGKTTTTRAIRCALGGAPHEPAPNSGGWLCRALFAIPPGSRHAVIEVGVHTPGEMACYARLLRPDVVAVVAIGSEHSGSFGNLETTRNEKAEMVRSLPASGCAVLNGDDPNVRWMAGETRAEPLFFGFGEENRVRASHLSLDWPHGTRFRLHADGVEAEATVRLFGKAAVASVLAAIAVALHERMPLGPLLASLARLEPAHGRLQPLVLPNGAIVLRDHLKSPVESIDAALDLMAEIPAARRIVVLGDVNEPPRPVRRTYRRLGARTAQIAASAVLLMSGGNVTSFLSGAVAAGLPRGAVTNVGNNVRRAIDLLRRELRPGDVALVKGREAQRLDRIVLALSGREVRCTLSRCGARLVDCESCSMLERGWPGQPIGV